MSKQSHPIATRLALFCICCLLAVGMFQPVMAVQNQPKPSTNIAAPVTDPFAHGLLWRIEKEGLNTHHLLATIHSDNRRVLELSEPVRNAFFKSGTYIGEVSFDKTTIANISTTVFFKDGRKLEPILGPTLYKQVVQISAEYGLVPELLEAMKPWAVAGTLMVPQANTGEFLDLLLFKAAESQEKKIFTLESAAEQAELFEGLPMEDQVALVREVVKMSPKIPQLNNDLIDRYLARDLRAVAKILDRFISADNPQLGKRLFHEFNEQRKERFTNRLLPHLKGGRAFIALGAQHVAGPTGLLSRLRQSGFRLTPVY